jgi:hypothetical protein
LNGDDGSDNDYGNDLAMTMMLLLFAAAHFFFSFRFLPADWDAAI